MSEVSIQLCDLCEEPLSGYHPKTGHKKVKSKQGLIIVVGYSNGGWGLRQNHIEWSGEVCSDCYKSIIPAVTQLQEAMDTLKPKKKRKGLLALL